MLPGRTHEGRCAFLVGASRARGARQPDVLRVSRCTCGGIGIGVGGKHVRLRLLNATHLLFVLSKRLGNNQSVARINKKEFDGFFYTASLGSLPSLSLSAFIVFLSPSSSVLHTLLHVRVHRRHQTLSQDEPRQNLEPAWQFLFVKQAARVFARNDAPAMPVLRYPVR